MAAQSCGTSKPTRLLVPDPGPGGALRRGILDEAVRGVRPSAVRKWSHQQRSCLGLRNRKYGAGCFWSVVLGRSRSFRLARGSQPGLVLDHSGIWQWRKPLFFCLAGARLFPRRDYRSAVAALCLVAGSSPDSTPGRLVLVRFGSELCLIHVRSLQIDSRWKADCRGLLD